MAKEIGVTLALVLLFLFTPTLGLAEQDDANQVYEPALFQALEYRMIGPYRGGRVTAVTGVVGDPFTYYMGATGGGVWKTTSGGQTWTNISDGFFETGSIGAVAVAESDANVVYAGTGSACPRGNVSPGVGIYKSTDAGDTWTHVGLRKAGQIARVVIHPDNADHVYVAALGNIFGRNEERGVFRTTDGGTTWEKVLYVHDGAGAADLVMDASNPRVLYASIWRAERKPWTIISGDERGGVFKSTDGGDHWAKLSGGLPTGLVGRIGLAVSPVDPRRVWALVEAPEDGGIYFSADAGASWSRINRDRLFQQRAWYYMHIYADPIDENTVYTLNTRFYKSVDGGKSFSSIPTPHGDNHDLWLNPGNPDIMIEGNDGGATVSFDGGENWSSLHNQPTAEFYRVSVDDEFLYRVHGAQQDNSSITIPSRVQGGLTPENHWIPAGGGESGHVVSDPRNPSITVGGNYGGEIYRRNLATGEVRNIIIYPVLQDGYPVRELDYRFQWNAPIRFSPHDPNVLYHTSHLVHRTTDNGHSWETISPDLTTNNVEQQVFPGGPITHDHTGVEVYNTIFAFEESPHQPGLLWVGTDDGLVHLSRDGGRSWVDITPNAMPEGGTVNMIDLSAHEPGRAFIAVYRYREDDFTPYIFRTDDFGESWERLTDGNNGIPADHFVRVVREDPDRKGLLYAGTEFGMYLSFGDGAHWQPFQLNLPVTPVTDLAVHRQDLVVATQGRSFWILDDVTPLHQISDEVAKAASFLFEPRDTYRVRLSTPRGSHVPDNPPNGAVVHYYFEQEPEGEVALEILDANGDLVRRYSSEPTGREPPRPRWGTPLDPLVPKKKGTNRFVWDLTYPGPALTDDALMYIGYNGGPTAVPGTYQVRLTSGAWTTAESFEIKKDPRVETTVADYQEQFDLMIRVRDTMTETHDGIRKIRDIREQVKMLTERLAASGYGDEITSTAGPLIEKLTAAEESLIQTKNEAHQDPINFPPAIDTRLGFTYGYVHRLNGKPTEGAHRRFEDLKAQLATKLANLQSVLDGELAAFISLLRDSGVPPIVVER
jgi:photosystem II stability/assembly factor-like uncharacterized protein